MNKKILAAAVAAAMVAPAAAFANDVTIYGVAHLSVDYLDSDIDGIDGFDVASRASRLGFKGTEDLANGLKAIWKMEFQVDMADSGNQEVDSFNRQATSAQIEAARSAAEQAAAEDGLTPDEIAAAGDEAALAREDAGALASVLALYSGVRGTPTASQGTYRGRLAPKSDLWSARNAYVGLAGGWGTFLVGRHDTPYKMSTGKLDLFSDEFADYNSMIGFQDIRTNSAIAYVSPNWSGFSFAAATVAPHLYDTNSGTDSDSLAGAYSLAATYDNAGFFATVAYEVLTEDWLEAWGGQTTGLDLSDAVENDDTKWRFGLGWTGAGFTIGGIYEMQDDTLGVDGFDIDRWQIQAGYTFGNNMVKAMYGQEDYDNDDIIDADADSWAIGLDHNFSKRTKVYMQYADRDEDATDLNDVSGFSIGMVHKF